MMELDHIAISADTLREGREAVEAALGVVLQPGGQHAHFGTHNLLLGLEDGLYLEVIAIDPEATAAHRPRWFHLDAFSGAPRLTNWICRTDDLEQACAALPGAGGPVALARGDLRWQMAVPDSGLLPYDNCFPALIEWQGATHPARGLMASGCRLRWLVVHHPQARELQAALEPHLSDARIAYQTGDAMLVAELDTPGGLAVLA